MSKELKDLLSLFKEKKYSLAEKKCSKLIKKIKPNYEIFNIYAVILFELNKYDEAIKYWKKATELNPQYHFGYNNLGNVFHKKSEFKEALNYYNEAIKIKPDYYEAYYNKGSVFLKINDISSALSNFDKALKIKSDYLPALKGRNTISIKQKNLDKALIELDKIIIYDSNNHNLYVQKADIYYEKKYFEKALENYQLAFDLNPDHPFLIGNMIGAKTKICNWDNIDKDLKKLEENILNKKKASPPYTATTLFDSPQITLETAKTWEKHIKPEKKIDLKFSKISRKKIKLGFYSADFRTHAMGHLMVQMLESHDKGMFELHGFYFGPQQDDKDLLQKRILKCFDSFHDISNQDNDNVLKLSKQIGIDIAIDLMGHTGNNNRFGIFLNRIAPIQINFLGYPGTSGSKSVDYIVADKVLIPEKNQKYFLEKIIYLPDTYQANEDTKKISKKNFTKEMFGLPKDKFIFCSFNANHKINYKIFNVWLRILLENKNSVLWIMSDNSSSQTNLRNYASKNKLDLKQLVFAEQLPFDEHLKRLELADLVLDTFPYNAHTTCSDALRVNLPILTLKGEGFASRVAASLLNSIGVNELITESIDDYEKLALKISNDKEYFKKIKLKIKKNKSKSNLFRSDVYTKNIERAYIEAYKNFLKGYPLKNIEL
jgi:protein O-GlcNAc transferase